MKVISPVYLNKVIKRFYPNNPLLNMMGILHNIKIFISKYYLIILGFVVFSIYFWSRFLRSRTSKELPLNLSILYFFIFVYICIIFSIIIFSILFPRGKNEFFEKLLDWIFTPLFEFDNYLKNLPFITSYYQIFMKYFILKMKYFIIETNLFLIISWFIPRIILLMALYLDAFYFYRLHYKYMVISFGLLLFFNRYFRYSIKKYKSDLIKMYEKYIVGITTPYVQYIHPAELDPHYDPTDPDEQDIIEFMSLPFKTFIEFQAQSKVYEGITREISTLHYNSELKKKVWKRVYGFEYPEEKSYFKIDENYQKYKNIKDICEEEANNFTEETLQVALVVEYYNKSNTSNVKLKKLKLLIYLNYLLCWLYILIVSLHTLDLEELSIVLIRTWLLQQDPFTDLYIFQFYK